MCDMTHTDEVEDDGRESPELVRSCVLQCVKSVLQCCAVCCSVLQYVAVLCSVLQCIPECCSVLQCVAVCCSALQCVNLRIMANKSP